MNNNQFSLLKQRKFAPLFVVQALGAFNDNIFKNSLMLLLAFDTASKLPYDTNLLMNVCAFLFILPFLVFSGTAGRLADKLDMDVIIRQAKLAEIVIMGMATLAYYFEAYGVLIGILFLMGTQSAFFGPVKFAYLPRKLEGSELLGGNALFEMGTFVSILLGTIYGGYIVGLDHALLVICVSVLVLAVLGYAASFLVPSIPSQSPHLTVSWNLYSQTISTFKVSLKYKDVFYSMVAISWFWFLGAAYLTQIPNFTKEILQGNNEVVTLLLALFSVGVAVGSLLCEKFSKHSVEVGLVPFGSIGLTISGIALFFVTPTFDAQELMDFKAFLAAENTQAILITFLSIGFFGGIYSVPLMAYVQHKSDQDEKAQNIAALNILNALFMVVSAIAGVIFLSLLKFSIPEFFLLLAIMNIVVALLVFKKVPLFLERFFVYLKFYNS